MKNILLYAALLFLPLGLQAKTEIPANDYRVTYVGRVLEQSGMVSYDWSGTTVRVCFSGTELQMVCSDSKKDYFNIWIDKEPCAKEDAVVMVSGESQTITLARKLKKGAHIVTVQKRTEGEQGTLTIYGFSTDGSFGYAPGLKERHIEFVGDSYTCGYGTEGPDRNAPFLAETENANLAYAQIIGRFFDADVNTVSHSGRGIVRNYGDFNPEDNMVKKYSQVFDEGSDLQWEPSMAAYTPDIVVIYLGTNDFSVGKQPALNSWCGNYSGLLLKIRSYYGDQVPILCVASKADELMGYYVKTAVERSGIANVSWTAIQDSAHDSEGDLGSSWHPNYKGQRKVACCMIPYISTLTGWDLPVKPIE